MVDYRPLLNEKHDLPKKTIAKKKSLGKTYKKCLISIAEHLRVNEVHVSLTDVPVSSQIGDLHKF